MQLLHKTFLTMLVVMDPVGLAPIFVGLVGHRSEADRRAMALKGTLVAGMIVLVFGLFGRSLLTHLEVSLDSFRVAGGLLLFVMAVDMVFARSSGNRETAEEEQEALLRRDISVFPLAISLIAGPGALASIMILASDAHGSPAMMGGVFLVTGAVLLLCYVALRLSGQISRVIGLTGVHVVTRVLGLLLGALAVQYVVGGAHGLLANGL